MDRLFAEKDRADGPRSSFARVLGVHYDHDDLECDCVDEPAPLEALVRGLSFADSFAHLIAEEDRRRRVSAVALLFGSDFSSRAPNAPRRLAFVGSFPYEAP